VTECEVQLRKSWWCLNCSHGRDEVEISGKQQRERARARRKPRFDIDPKVAADANC
jgi:hypothetical protein